MATTTVSSLPRLRRIVYSLGVLAVVVAAFALGMAFGDHDARFDEHYFRPGGEQGFVSRIMPFLPGGHGADGTVVAVSGSGFVIAEPGETEKTVVVGPATITRRFRSEASTTEISVGDSVIVLGSPDSQGVIHASFVRVIPAASTSPAESQ